MHFLGYLLVTFFISLPQLNGKEVAYCGINRYEFEETLSLADNILLGLIKGQDEDIYIQVKEVWKGEVAKKIEIEKVKKPFWGSTVHIDKVSLSGDVGRDILVAFKGKINTLDITAKCDLVYRILDNDFEKKKYKEVLIKNFKSPKKSY